MASTYLCTYLSILSIYLLSVLMYSNYVIYTQLPIYQYLSTLAEGYGRSESTVVFFIQRAEDAKRQYATIVFSESYFLGSKPTTLLAYDQKTLVNFIKTIYEQNECADLISQLSFLELSACGLKVTGLYYAYSTYAQ